jgi:hypothetical protein
LAFPALLPAGVPWAAAGKGRSLCSEFFGIVEDILGGQFLVGLEFAVNGEFRTDDLAEIAIDAFALLGHLRRMIAFLIEFGGFFEDLVGAEFDAKVATLAAIFDDDQLTLRDGMVLGIQRQPPEFHEDLKKIIVNKSNKNKEIRSDCQY